MTLERTQPLSLSAPDLKIVKTAIGVLLNTSIGYGTSIKQARRDLRLMIAFRARESQIGFTRGCLHYLETRCGNLPPWGMAPLSTYDVKWPYFYWY